MTACQQTSLGRQHRHRRRFLLPYCRQRDRRRRRRQAKRAYHDSRRLEQDSSSTDQRYQPIFATRGVEKRKKERRKRQQQTTTTNNSRIAQHTHPQLATAHLSTVQVTNGALCRLWISKLAESKTFRLAGVLVVDKSTKQSTMTTYDDPNDSSFRFEHNKDESSVFYLNDTTSPTSWKMSISISSVTPYAILPTKTVFGGPCNADIFVALVYG